MLFLWHLFGNLTTPWSPRELSLSPYYRCTLTTSSGRACLEFAWFWLKFLHQDFWYRWFCLGIVIFIIMDKDTRRKRKNSAPLPAYGKKAIQSSLYPPLTAHSTVSLTQPSKRDGGDSSQSPNVQSAAQTIAASMCTIRPISSTETGSRSSSDTTVVNDTSLLQPPGPQPTNTTKTIHRLKPKGKQKEISASQPSNNRKWVDDLDLSQSSTHSYAWGSCLLDIPHDQLNHIALQCCLCDRHFHGVCCKFDESSMEYIHIMTNIGGWCCLVCNSNENLNQTQKNAENIDFIRQDLSRINEQLKNLTNNLSSMNSACSQPIFTNSNTLASKEIPLTIQDSSSLISANNHKSYAQSPKPYVHHNHQKFKNKQANLNSISNSRLPFSLQYTQNSTRFRNVLWTSSSLDSHPVTQSLTRFNS